jgi:light-regulated signal transduction histidine kinase (bacteriophytochrome)
MLKELEAPFRSNEEIKYLEIISKGAEEMGRLIDALLSFSKLQRTDLRKSIINTTELVNSVIGYMNEDIKERNIEFRIGNIPDCMGDEQLIKLVWINLISNAIKYTSKNSKAEIEIGSIDNENENVFFIRDNGVGFDMQYAGKLFGVFQRLHHQRDFEGIGIGLANVNSIILRHGGTCSAEGEVDRGAAFYFSLPK